LVDRRGYATNIICHISHGPLRYYVMGERAYEDHDATAEDVDQMAAIVAEAMGAGASGFSTNRFQIHKSRTGRIVPGTFAPHEELRAIAAKVGEAGHGIIQAISEGTLYPNPEVDEMPELDLFANISIDTGRPLTFTTAQSNPGADIFRRVLDGATAWNARGAQLRPQIIPRAVTIMTTLAGYHGYIFRPSYKKIADLPVAERAAEMRRPEVRERILSETDEPTDTGEYLLAMVVMNNLDLVFPLAAPIDYEPDPSRSIAGQAKALGKDPAGHYYDLMTAGDGGAFFAALTSNFHDGTLEPCREMQLDANTVSGLSDAGAHVMMISDCSATTFHLTHWVRDRTKGERIPLETAVHKLTGAPAQMYGFTDRGLIREGMRADINVIDFERLTIEEPIIRADLPTGARRILQPATGYLARLVNGVMVRRNDIDTGERPGRLLRSGVKAVAA
jgi:N-acyl-D-aspartate/D-glutamate deacylase